MLIRPVREHIPLEQGLRHVEKIRLVDVYSVREHIPLEQGLRQNFIPDKIVLWISQRAYSIRTRIKTSRMLTAASLRMIVREHIPLEQGLRRVFSLTVVSKYSIREHIPLEQGLRLNFRNCVVNNYLSESIFH